MSVVHHRCRIRGLLPHGFMVVMLVASGLSAGVVPASDDLILDEASPLSAPQALPMAGNLPALVIMGNNRVIVRGQAGILRQVPAAASPTVNLGSLFDRMVFVPQLNNRLGKPAGGGGLDSLRSRGAARVALFDRICGLSPSQQRTLRLTLASDLAGFEANYETARARYVGTDMPVRPMGIDRELLAALQADAAVCRGQWQRLFGSGSLLGGVERELLDAEQADRFRAWLDDRRATRWRTMVEDVLLDEDARRLWKSPQAAAEVVAVMTADVPPLAVFDAATDPAVEGRMKKFQQLLVHLRLDRIDEATLRSLADPGHWRRLRHEIDRAKEPGVEQVKRQLIERQVIEESQP